MRLRVQCPDHNYATASLHQYPFCCSCRQKQCVRVGCRARTGCPPSSDTNVTMGLAVHSAPTFSAIRPLLSHCSFTCKAEKQSGKRRLSLKARAHPCVIYLVYIICTRVEGTRNITYTSTHYVLSLDATKRGIVCEYKI